MVYKLIAAIITCAIISLSLVYYISNIQDDVTILTTSVSGLQSELAEADKHLLKLRYGFNRNLDPIHKSFSNSYQLLAKSDELAKDDLDIHNSLELIKARLKNKQALSESMLADNAALLNSLAAIGKISDRNFPPTHPLSQKVQRSLRLIYESTITKNSKVQKSVSESLEQLEPLADTTPALNGFLSHAKVISARQLVVSDALRKILAIDIENPLKFLKEKVKGKRKTTASLVARSGAALLLLCLSLAIWVTCLVNSVSKTSKKVKSINEELEQVVKERTESLVSANSELSKALETSEAATQAKSDFLANMSHEIRTPMTAILGYIEIMDSDKEIAQDPKQRADALSTIRTNANHLLTIINDILDLSKIEAGKLDLEKIETSPIRVVNEAVKLLQTKAEEKGIRLLVEYASAIPEYVKTDPTRLHQILINLAGNAIKFTQEGSVSLRISCDKESDRLHFNIIDTGIGMTPEQVKIISTFEAFSQADTSTTRKFGGTGLGLRISNSLSKMLGGQLEISSAVGKGTRMQFSIATDSLNGIRMLSNSELLDFIPVEENTTRKVNFSCSEPLDNIRILLAEDGIDNQRLVSFHLRKAGAEVHIVENGQLAVDYLNQVQDSLAPQVVLMDMQMPELDGYSATRLLRQQGFEIPILALTAHAMASDRDKCLNAGCDDFLTKPLNKKALIETCASWSNRKHLDLTHS